MEGTTKKMVNKITRYEPNWDESSQSMELHPSGDYVEYNDHIEVVRDLQDKIDRLQEAIDEAFQTLREEAS
jgi:hypothetical protein